MKPEFEGYLDLRYLNAPVNGKWFKTLKSFRYTDSLGNVFNIPQELHTDFASIPKGFRWMISRVGKYGKAAVFHDWLCEYKIVPRKKADRLFLEAMKVLGVGWLKRRALYAGVRAYSIATFKK